MEAQKTDETKKIGCQLGRELGECVLRGKCGSLLDVLTYMHPPLTVIAAALGSNDDKVRSWARRMQDLLAPLRPAQYTRQNGGSW